MSSPHHQPQVDGSTSSTAGPGGQPFPAAKSLSGFQEHPFVSPPGIRVLTAPTIASPEMLPHHFKFPLILSTLCCSSSLRGMLSQLPHFSCVVTCSCYGTNECDAPLLLNPECHRLSLFSPLTPPHPSSHSHPPALCPDMLPSQTGNSKKQRPCLDLPLPLAQDIAPSQLWGLLKHK